MKLAQGFTQIQLTPFAIPLDNLINTLETSLKAHHKQGKLLGTKENPEAPDEPLELAADQLMSVWDEWRGSDKDGSCVYHPTSFDQTKHNGHTKAEILKAQEGLPLAGWNVLMVEPNKNIPRRNQGKTIGKRKQLETNKKPTEYLKLLQTDPQYQNEQGLTNEDWLIEFLIHLEENNQVIDDWKGKGSACYLTGSFKPFSRGLGVGGWYRDVSRASLRGNDQGSRDDRSGSRSAVGVG